MVWTSVLAMVALTLREGYELLTTDVLAIATTGIAILAVGLSVALDIDTLRRSSSRLQTLRRLAPEAVLTVLVLVLLGRPALWALTVFVRQALTLGRLASGTARYRRVVDSLHARPAKTLALSFVAIVVVGSVLLTFPHATTDGRGAGFVDAIFTSTSATCVTGLTTLNTVADAFAAPARQSFTPFGQVVILILIQIGGLGIMTLSAAMVVLTGRRLRLKSASMMRSILDEESSATLRRAIRDIFVMTFTIEAAGALVLFLRFWTLTGDVEQSLWLGAFHAISAFCNAGFSLFGDSLASFTGDTIINLTHAALIILGGLGFTVVTALALSVRTRRGAFWRRLSLQVRLVVAMTVGLIVVGTIAYYFLEYDHSLEGLPLGEKLLASFFHSVSFRTAGFNTVDMGSLSRGMLVIACILMFIGANPGSTGGGVKTSTIGVLFMSVRSALSGRPRVEFYNRTVPPLVVNRAISIVATASVVLIVGLVLLLATQPHLDFEALFFESVSALGTVGLSLGATPELTDAGKMIVVVLMFVGRVGPLTVAMAVGERQASTGFRYPEDRFVVG